MIYLISFIVLAAIFHFVWESILAPSFRLGLRFELFRLRDEVRWLHYHERNECDEEVFRFLQSSINNGLRILPRTDFSLLHAVDRAIANDENLRKRIEKRRSLLDACTNPEVKRIENRIENIGRRAFAANTAGWVIYVLPLFGMFKCISAIKRFIREALLVPESELEKITPSGMQLQPA